MTHELGALDSHVDWAQRFYAEIEPSLTGGAYVNFLSARGHSECGRHTGAKKFTRLRALKDCYDPNAARMTWS